MRSRMLRAMSRANRSCCSPGPRSATRAARDVSRTSFAKSGDAFAGAIERRDRRIRDMGDLVGSGEVTKVTELYKYSIKIRFCQCKCA